jgi:TRAP-type C4-dicarboxylate transport system substrate-binding protein
MSMLKSNTILIVSALVASSTAFGKLPPPSADEQAAAAAKKAAEQAQLETEKTLLEKAQDRVVARYRGESSTRQQAAGGRTPDQNMPKTASERPGGTGPDPVRPQSAEAHSAPAK